MSKFFIIGATGLVGSSVLEAFSKKYPVESLSRRPIKGEVSKAYVEQDLQKWADIIRSSKPEENAIFFSGLGTTRAAAGGLDKQYEIDYTLNYECAKAAKEAGYDTYVLISSTLANSKSFFPYLKMKGQLDDSVSQLGFKRTVILRPGVLLGEREKQPLFHKIANPILELVKKAPVVNDNLVMGVHGSDIARALDKILAKDGTGVEIHEAKEIAKLGRE